MNRHLYIVEGKTDISRLKAAGAHFVAMTNGLFVSERLIRFLQAAERHRHLVLCLDPDGPGERIRQRLHGALTNYSDVRLSKYAAAAKRKIGVAEARPETIKKALNDFIAEDRMSAEKDGLNPADMVEIGLSGPHISANREKLYGRLPLVGDETAKTLCDELNILEIDKSEAERLIK